MKFFSSNISRRIGLSGIALLLWAQGSANADELIEGAKLCTRHLPRYEREYAIPTHLLSAIASTESGRYHDGLKLKLPWPWTINAAGKGYFFNNKEEAIAAVHRLRAEGIQSIDVGCMQVNLYQHPDAFSSLDQAFEPETNIAYAASFLHDLYAEEGTWKKAAADYHSRTPKLGSGYVDIVYDSWFTIIERLRAARLKVPESSVIGMNDLKNGQHVVTPQVINVANAQYASRQPARLPEQEGRSISSYTSPHMKVITIKNSYDTPEKPGHNHDILTITAPKPIISDVAAAPASVPAKSSEIVTADATALPALTPTAAAPITPQTAILAATPATASSAFAPVSASQAATIAIATQAVAALPNVIPVASTAVAPAHKAGPNFIFND